jgi:spore maturation protein SpmA
MPKVLVEINPNKKIATDPLIPSSVIAIVGITEITNSIVVVRITLSINEISTSKICRRIKN